MRLQSEKGLLCVSRSIGSCYERSMSRPGATWSINTWESRPNSAPALHSSSQWQRQVARRLHEFPRLKGYLTQKVVMFSGIKDLMWNDLASLAGLRFTASRVSLRATPMAAPGQGLARGRPFELAPRLGHYGNGLGLT